MSFSSDIKNELFSKVSNINAEKFGEYLTQNYTKNELSIDFKEYFDISKIDENCIRAILQGAFLSAGYIIDPNIEYHLEILTKNKVCADYLSNLLSVLDFTPKVIKKKKTNFYTIYIKEAEQISIFLSIIGATSCMLEFENIRVHKNVKNQVNRTTNCETANLSKTINASVRQIEAIDKIKKAGVYDKLNDKLKVTIRLREMYPDESLDYISNMTNGEDKISKSGLKHRLDKIMQIASNIKE